MKKYPFEEKTIEELLREAEELLKHSCEMTKQEEIEEDAEFGYFEDD